MNNRMSQMIKRRIGNFEVPEVAVDQRQVDDFYKNKLRRASDWEKFSLAHLLFVGFVFVSGFVSTMVFIL